jgi:hypothetical protein
MDLEGKVPSSKKSHKFERSPYDWRVLIISGIKPVCISESLYR